MQYPLKCVVEQQLNSDEKLTDHKDRIISDRKHDTMYAKNGLPVAKSLALDLDTVVIVTY